LVSVDVIGYRCFVLGCGLTMMMCLLEILPLSLTGHLIDVTE
jgi:hypothetical protein